MKSHQVHQVEITQQFLCRLQVRMGVVSCLSPWIRYMIYILSLSPGHPSPSTQRVSPPPSDFNYEGVSLIGIALDKYSKKKRASSNFSDSQLISKEIAERLNPTPNQERKRYSGSVSSVESNSTASLGGLESEVQGGSYGAMLRSYARRTGGGGSISENTGEASPQLAGSALRTAGSGTQEV